MSSAKPFSNGMFCWYEIGTRDAAAAKSYYTQLFGWSAMDIPMPGSQGGAYTLLQMDGKDVAGLYTMEGPMFEGMPPCWMVYLWADDVDAAAARVKALKGTVMAEPFDIPGVGRMAGCQDPTGAAFCLFHGTEHPGTARIPARHGVICWSELLTKNPDQAGRFYTALFPWGSKGSSAGTGYTEFQLGGESIAGMMETRKEWGDVPSHWGIYVQVDDCDAAVAKAKTLGAEAVVPPTDVPKVGRFSTLADPTGAVLSVIALG